MAERDSFAFAVAAATPAPASMMSSFELTMLSALSLLPILLAFGFHEKTVAKGTVIL